MDLPLGESMLMLERGLERHGVFGMVVRVSKVSDIARMLLVIATESVSAAVSSVVSLAVSSVVD